MGGTPREAPPHTASLAFKIIALSEGKRGVSVRQGGSGGSGDIDRYYEYIANVRARWHACGRERMYST